MDQAVIPHGATAAEFTLRRFGRNVRLIESVVNTANGLFSQLLANNPRRIFWLISNVGLVNFQVAFSPNPPFNTGITIGSVGGYISMDVFDDGEVVAWPVYYFTNNLVPTIYTLEIVAV